ncbi:MAG TPA: ABC transporter ATP-binding protein [Solirubrobacteraceae bacterium]|nr:ABC transporter ATP-binding protein [Solirubrobacteraceae bacterium]
MAELRCDQITASYGRDAVLSGVDLVVPDGTLTAILGASGSGKTTLLRVIMGFIAQQQGTVTVGGTVVARAGDVHLPPEKRSIGYVAQEGALYPHLSVAENVSFGLPRRERKQSARALEVLDLVGLDARYAERRPHELSGGEQRRVALARALAPRPPLVLLDEPFSGLDAALRAETRAAVLHALAAQGTTAVLVTHDQAEALSMGREVGVLMAGHLIQTAAPAVLYRTPLTVRVARFVGEAVVVPGRADGGTVSCPLGELALVDREVHGLVDAMIRPEQIRVHRPEPGEADRGVTATVSARTFYGPDSVLRLQLDGMPEPVSARVLGHDAPAPGERVHLTVSGEVMAYPRANSSAASDPASSERTALLTGPPSR